MTEHLHGVPCTRKSGVCFDDSKLVLVHQAAVVLKRLPQGWTRA